MSIACAPVHALPHPAKTGHVPGHAARSAVSRWAARRFGGLPREYWLLAAGAGIFRLGFFVIPFRAFYLSSERHLSAAAAGMVMVAFGLGWAASQPVGGWLADRWGRRAVITAGAFTSAGAFLAFGSARGFGLLALSACAAGLTFDLYRPALSALTTEVVPEPGRRKKALAVLYLTLNLGRGAACLIGGTVASAGHAFWPLFVANAVINIAFGVAVYRCVRPDRPQRTNVAPARLRVAVRDRRLLVFTGITLVFYTVHMQSVIALPLVIAEHGTTPWQFGLLLALDPLIVAAVQLAVQHKLLSTTALHACAAGVAMVGIGLAVAGAGSGVGWYAATMPLWIAGEVLFLAVAQDVVAALAPPERIGCYFGLWGLSQGLAALLAPIGATVLIGLGGTALLWASGAALGIAAAAACLVLQHARPCRRLATGSAQVVAGPAHRGGLPGLTGACRRPTLPPQDVHPAGNIHRGNLARPHLRRPGPARCSALRRRTRPNQQRRPEPATHHEPVLPHAGRPLMATVPRRNVRPRHPPDTHPGQATTTHPRRGHHRPPYRSRGDPRDHRPRPLRQFLRPIPGQRLPSTNSPPQDQTHPSYEHAWHPIAMAATVNTDTANTSTGCQQ